MSPPKKDKRRIITANNLPGSTQMQETSQNKPDSIYTSENYKEIKNVELKGGQQNSTLYLINLED